VLGLISTNTKVQTVQWYEHLVPDLQNNNRILTKWLLLESSSVQKKGTQLFLQRYSVLITVFYKSHCGIFTIRSQARLWLIIFISINARMCTETEKTVAAFHHFCRSSMCSMMVQRDSMSVYQAASQADCMDGGGGGLFGAQPTPV